MNSDQLHEYLLLLDARYSAEDEMPQDFPYREQVKTLQKVCKEIERTTCIKCGLDTHIQDAYFFSEIEMTASSCGLDDGDVCLNVRFSNFGSMAAIELNERCPRSADFANIVSERLAFYGFLPVSAEWLQSNEYDGIYEYFRQKRYSWWYRFFEYT